MRLLIRNTLILPMTVSPADSAPYFAGHVGVEGNRITLVTSCDEAAEHFCAQVPTTVIDGRGKLTMPGLINAHTHVAMTLLRGYAEDMPLMEWLTRKVWPFEAKLTPDDIYWGAKLGVGEMLLSGTTTFVDMYFEVPSTARAVEESGIRAVLSSALFDRNVDRFEEQTRSLVASYGTDPHRRISILSAPHATYTCSPATLECCHRMATQYGLGVHLHLSETVAERTTIRDQYDATSAEYIDRSSLFDRPVIAAHCIYLNPSDRELFHRAGASIVHCPQSNMKLASGIAPVADYLNQGINVALGTDGASSNNDQSLWDELRSAALLGKVSTGDPTVMDAYTVLRMATVNGAKAIGMEGELGIIAEGALADLILIDLDRPHLYPRHDLLNHLVYSVQSSDVHTVVVDGTVVVADRKILRFDIAETCQEVERRTQAILDLLDA